MATIEQKIQYMETSKLLPLKDSLLDCKKALQIMNILDPHFFFDSFTYLLNTYYVPVYEFEKIIQHDNFNNTTKDHFMQLHMKNMDKYSFHERKIKLVNNMLKKFNISLSDLENKINNNSTLEALQSDLDINKLLDETLYNTTYHFL